MPPGVTTSPSMPLVCSVYQATGPQRRIRRMPLHRSAQGCQNRGMRTIGLAVGLTLLVGCATSTSPRVGPASSEPPTPCSRLIPQCHAERLPNLVLAPDIPAPDGTRALGPVTEPMDGTIGFDEALIRAWQEDGRDASKSKWCLDRPTLRPCIGKWPIGSSMESFGAGRRNARVAASVPGRRLFASPSQREPSSTRTRERSSWGEAGRSHRKGRGQHVGLPRLMICCAA